MEDKIRQVILLPTLLIAIFYVWGVTHLSGFLTINRTVESRVMVVEGWLFDYMLDNVAQEIINGKYTTILISGIEGKIANLAGTTEHEGLKSNAEYCKVKLIERGIDESIIHAVPAQRTKFHHTFYSAVAIKEWLSDKNINDVNVFSGGTHGRKTYVVYKRVLGNTIKTGIVSIPSKHFKSSRWWLSRKRVLIIFKHLVGYIYALCWPFWLY